MKLKQLFCNHIYKQIKYEESRRTREEYFSLGGISYYSGFQYYICYYKCVKCGKEKAEEIREMII